MVRINIEESSMNAVDINLSDTPDLGDLTPGNAAPPEAADGAKGSASENPEIALPPSAEAAPEAAAGTGATNDQSSEDAAPTNPTEPAETGNSE